MRSRSSAPPAKVLRPPCPGALPRRRLFRVLDRARRRPVLWVSGPPGSGKTTLVSSYLEARRLPGLWYRADRGDADVGTLFHYLGLAASAAAPGRRAPLPLPPSQFRPDLATFARRYFEELCGRLEVPSVIVLDDLQEVPDASAFFEVLREGAASLTKGMTLVLVSRREPPPSLARLRAGEMLARIGWDDLRLTPAETKGMAGRKGLRAGGGEGWRRLHAATDGWAAGVVLLLEAGMKGATALLRRGEGGPEDVFDYFAGEILSRVDGATRDLLLAASFLPETTPSLAEEALGLRGAGPILSALARENAFVERLPGAEPAFRFHALFRRFLVATARESLPRERIRRLRISAAAALEERGRFEEAAGLLLEAGDRAGMARLVRDRAPVLFGQGRSRTVAEWLSALPGEVVDGDAWLTYWRGRARLPYEPEESRRDFERAFREFIGRRDARGVFLAWSGVVDALIYGAEGLKPLDPWISSLDDLLASFHGFPDAAVEARTTLSMLKASALRRPTIASARAWAERAEAVARETADVPLKVEALVNLAYYWYHGGEFRRTEIALESLRGMAGRPESGPLSRLAVAWIEAAHANMSARYDRCLDAVAAGLELAARAGIRVMDYILMGHGALAALHRGDSRTARRFVRTMARSLGTARPWEAAFFHFVAGWEALGRKDVASARLHADSSLSLAERVGNPWMAALAHLEQAFVSHEEGRIASSRRHLSAARRLGVRHGLDFLRFACQLAEASFLLERGEGEKALPVLREGMRWGREKGFEGIFVWRPGLLERVAMKSLEAGIETEYVRRLVRRHDLLPGEGREEAESWPWPVRICALGGLKVVRDEEPLTYSKRAPQRPLLLLKALIALGGREVPEGRLTDLLWPDSEGDMAEQSFRTNVVRLRRLLGRDEAVPHREGRLSLDGRYCWVDVWALERCCRRVEEIAAGQGGAAERDLASLAGRAAALYRGPFLPEERERLWAEQRRQRLRTIFLRCLRLAGERLERQGKCEEAAAVYRKGLDSDPLAEDLYRRLMACYGRMGKIAEAEEVFRRCRAALTVLVGGTPSPETETLARSLLHLRTSP